MGPHLMSPAEMQEMMAQMGGTMAPGMMGQGMMGPGMMGERMMGPEM